MARHCQTVGRPAVGRCPARDARDNDAPVPSPAPAVPATGLTAAGMVSSVASGGRHRSSRRRVHTAYTTFIVMDEARIMRRYLAPLAALAALTAVACTPADEAEN